MKVHLEQKYTFCHNFLGIPDFSVARSLCRLKRLKNCFDCLRPQTVKSSRWKIRELRRQLVLSLPPAEQKEEQHREQIVWLQARNKIEPTKRKIVRKVAWIADSMDIMDIMDSMDSGWPSWSLANRFCGFRDSAALS